MQSDFSICQTEILLKGLLTYKFSLGLLRKSDASSDWFSGSCMFDPLSGKDLVLK